MRYEGWSLFVIGAVAVLIALSSAARRDVQRLRREQRVYVWERAKAECRRNCAQANSTAKFLKSTGCHCRNGVVFRPAPDFRELE